LKLTSDRMCKLKPTEIFLNYLQIDWEIKLILVCPTLLRFILENYLKIIHSRYIFLPLQELLCRQDNLQQNIIEKTSDAKKHTWKWAFLKEKKYSYCKKKFFHLDCCCKEG